MCDPVGSCVTVWDRLGSCGVRCDRVGSGVTLWDQV